jgi:hypothetical protein
MSDHQHTNRLIHETSPYLLQHAHNPVDWYAWGEEALTRARAEDKPIFLSIGYSACHWCHVMEHESFEDAATAALMNELFINIKVDREERPDLDAIYMDAVQAMTGQGGWPMSVLVDARRQALPRRHLLSARAALRDAELPAGAARRRRRLPQPPRPQWTARPSGWRRCCAARRPSSRRRRRSWARHPGGGARPDAPVLRRRGRRLRQPAQVPAADDARLCADASIPAHRRSRRALHGRADAGEDGARRHLRSARRRLPPLQRRRDLARPPLREDALRQRATAAHLSPRLAGDGAPALPPRRQRRRSTTCCAR